MAYPSNPSPGHPGQQPAYPAQQPAYPAQQPAGAPWAQQQSWPQQPQQPPGQYPLQQGRPWPGQQPPAGYGAPGPYQGGPQATGTLSASFIRHTGMLVLWQQSTRRCQGTFEEVNREYQAAQQHCLLAGWWSISSIIFFNWYALFRNMYEMSKVKKAAGR